MEKNAGENVWNKILLAALKVPGVKIDKEKFLEANFKKLVDDEQIAKAIETTPHEAGISTKIVDKIAKAVIHKQTIVVSAISFAMGLPGGFAMIATIPADIAQFYAQAIVLLQKISYLYGWPDFFELEKGEEISEEALLLITGFIGVMLGAAGAGKAINQIAGRLSAEVVKRLPREALTKYGIYNVTKNIAKWIGIKVTKDTFSKGIGKAIPIIGGVISGSISAITMEIMGNKLADNLKCSSLATGEKVNEQDVRDVEIEILSDEEEYKIELAQYKTLINLMKIDGIIHKNEKKFIAKLLKESCLTAEDKEKIKSSFDDDVLYAVNYEIFKNDGFESITLLSVLIGLAKADGVFDDSEKELILKVGKGVGMTEEEVIVLFD